MTNEPQRELPKIVFNPSCIENVESSIEYFQESPVENVESPIPKPPTHRPNTVHLGWNIGHHFHKVPKWFSCLSREITWRFVNPSCELGEYRDCLLMEFTFVILSMPRTPYMDCSESLCPKMNTLRCSWDRRFTSRLPFRQDVVIYTLGCSVMFRNHPGVLQVVFRKINPSGQAGVDKIWHTNCIWGQRTCSLLEQADTTRNLTLSATKQLIWLSKGLTQGTEQI